jgi:hypothetical protein
LAIAISLAAAPSLVCLALAPDDHGAALSEGVMSETKIPHIPSQRGDRDVRIAEGIYRTWCGWRTVVRFNGTRKRRRWKRSTPFEKLQKYVAGFIDERARRKQKGTRRRASVAGFTVDALRYLERKTVRAMASFDDRKRQIEYWMPVFGDRLRNEISAADIDEQLQAWQTEGKWSNSTINKMRTALMALWTALDGKQAANPVKATRLFEEPPAEARGLPYELVVALLDAMPQDLGRPVKGRKGSRKTGSVTHARLALMAWTGMTPAQMRELTPDNWHRYVNLAEGWYISPPRHKGVRQVRHPRPVIRKPLTAESRAAFDSSPSARGRVRGNTVGGSSAQRWSAHAKRSRRRGGRPPVIRS